MVTIAWRKRVKMSRMAGMVSNLTSSRIQGTCAIRLRPLAVKQCESVLRIPVKRGPKRSPCCLELEEVAAVLTQPDRQSVLGQRDYTLLGHAL